jgi:hypothetical protein
MVGTIAAISRDFDDYNPPASRLGT